MENLSSDPALILIRCVWNPDLIKIEIADINVKPVRKTPTSLRDKVLAKTMLKINENRIAINFVANMFISFNLYAC